MKKLMAIVVALGLALGVVSVSMAQQKVSHKKAGSKSTQTSVSRRK